MTFFNDYEPEYPTLLTDRTGVISFLARNPNIAVNNDLFVQYFNTQADGSLFPIQMSVSGFGSTYDFVVFRACPFTGCTVQRP